MSDQERFTVYQLLVDHDHHDHGVLQELWCRPSWFQPGPHNQRLASEIVQAYKDYALPIIAQWEVVAALPREFYQQHQQHIITIWPKADRDDVLSVRDVLVQAKRYCDRHGFRRPVILGHRRKTLRGMFAWRKIAGSWPIIYPTNVDGFDRESSVSCARDFWSWMRRESYLRWMQYPLNHWI